MKVVAIKTPLIRPGDSLTKIISQSIPKIPEKSILVIASKIFSFCENRIVKKKTGLAQEKHALVKKEAEFYTDPHSSKYNLMLTIKGNWMFVNAGIDESNSAGNYTLWPVNPQKSVNKVWEFLRQHYQVREAGVIMSDSRSFPLNTGVVGHGIAHCGFEALKSYIGKPDLFGRIMQMEQLNLVQSITAGAVVEMGEGDEQTPIAIITEVRDLKFQDREPEDSELKALKMNIRDDAYAPILLSAKWKKGRR
ncbi:MAG: coenzyme F420-0:L-glutamate ligase [Candidatus Blackburnbacteria bacterium]|nr:coenzyme F420-0:L-glutamate ligase [Candidatus Blackburnbacteria bacterium]